MGRRRGGLDFRLVGFLRRETGRVRLGGIARRGRWDFFERRGFIRGSLR